MHSLAKNLAQNLLLQGGYPCIIVFASLQYHFLVTQSCSVVLLHLFEDLRCVGSRLCGAAVWTWTAGLQEDDLLSIGKCRFEVFRSSLLSWKSPIQEVSQSINFIQF